MDLYALSSVFAPTTPIDVFDSLVWTERYSDCGDLTLVIPSSSPFRNTLVEGSFCGLSGTKEVMQILTVTEEGETLKIEGETLPTITKARMFRNTWQTASTEWGMVGGGRASALAQTAASSMLASNGLMSGTAILSSGGSLETFTYLSFSDEVSDGPIIYPSVPYGDLFTAIKTLCDLDDVGFTLYVSNVDDAGHYQLWFRTYRGVDRTSSQSTYPPVIFDSALDSLVDVQGVRSISGYRNVAYAWANNMPAQSAIGVAVASGASNLKEFQRRTLMVDANDVDGSLYTASQLKNILDQRARDALANNNYVRLTNGQIVPQSAYIYGIDYALGDVIELRGDQTTSSSARITEYIRAQDSTGERAYPTLSVIS